MKIYSVWTGAKGSPITFVEGADRPRTLNGSVAPDTEVLMFTIEAATWEEAQAIKHLRLGFEPYRPAGDPTPCPKCGSLFYPEGKGECWKCGYST